MEGPEFQRHKLRWRIVRIFITLLAVGSVARISWLKYAQLYRSDREYIERQGNCNNDWGRRNFPEICSPDTLHLFVTTFFIAFICAVLIALCVAVAYGSAVFSRGKGVKTHRCGFHVLSPFFEFWCLVGVSLAAAIMWLGEEALLAIIQ